MLQAEVPYPLFSAEERLCMHKRRCVAFTVAALVAASSLLSACGGSSNKSSTDGSSAPKAGGFLRIGNGASSPDASSPFQAGNFVALMAFRYNYPTLVKYNNDLTKIVPEFATKWTRSADG